MVDKDSKPKVKENLDITDELIAERRTSLKMPEVDHWQSIRLVNSVSNLCNDP